jgi:hypothetical protein
MCLNLFFKWIVIEMWFNLFEKIKWMYIKNNNHVHRWKYFKSKLLIFPFKQTSIKYEIYIEVDVCAMFKIKYKVNRMLLTIFSHQVGWFDGKGVDIYHLGLRIKLHKWHSCGQQWYIDHICLT